MEQLVFVYGTLKRGQRNHHMMGEAKFLREAVTRDADFYLIEADSVSTPGRTTPTVGENGHYKIGGELYAVSERVLEQLDEFEEVGVHYLRKPVALDDGRIAHMYLHMLKSTKQARAQPLHILCYGQTMKWAESA